MVSNSEPTADERAALVDRRNRIQVHLLNLWSFGNKGLDSLDIQHNLVFHHLVGASFALLRAAFLVQGTRTRSGLNNHAMAFLGKLTWNNAIGYSEDRASSAWTAGFYINDACFRLAYLSRSFRAKDFGKGSQLKPLRNELNKPHFSVDEPGDVAELWETAFVAAGEAFEILRRQTGR